MQPHTQAVGGCQARAKTRGGDITFKCKEASEAWRKAKKSHIAKNGSTKTTMVQRKRESFVNWQ